VKVKTKTAEIEITTKYLSLALQLETAAAFVNSFITKELPDETELRVLSVMSTLIHRTTHDVVISSLADIKAELEAGKVVKRGGKAHRDGISIEDLMRESA
jgi:hypothetical protein